MSSASCDKIKALFNILGTGVWSKQPCQKSHVWDCHWFSFMLIGAEIQFYMLTKSPVVRPVVQNTTQSIKSPKYVSFSLTFDCWLLKTDLLQATIKLEHSFHVKQSFSNYWLDANGLNGKDHEKHPHSKSILIVFNIKLARMYNI